MPGVNNEIYAPQPAAGFASRLLSGLWRNALGIALAALGGAWLVFLAMIFYPGQVRILAMAFLGSIVLGALTVLVKEGLGRSVSVPAQHIRQNIYEVRQETYGQTAQTEPPLKGNELNMAGEGSVQSSSADAFDNLALRISRLESIIVRHDDMLDALASQSVVQTEKPVVQAVHDAVSDVSMVPPSSRPSAAMAMGESSSQRSSKPAKKMMHHIQTDDSAAFVSQSLALLGKARVMVLSSEKEDGQSGSAGAVLLARGLAGLGESVVLLDMTGNGVSSGAMLAGQVKPGVRNLVAGTASFDQAIHNDIVSSAHIIPLGREADGVEKAFVSGKRLTMILNALDITYSFVIIDCGNSDIPALKQVSVENTLTLIVSNDEKHARSVASIDSLAEELVANDLTPPLVMQPTGFERSEMGVRAS